LHNIDVKNYFRFYKNNNTAFITFFYFTDVFITQKRWTFFFLSVKFNTSSRHFSFWHINIKVFIERFILVIKRVLALFIYGINVFIASVVLCECVPCTAAPVILAESSHTHLYTKFVGCHILFAAAEAFEVHFMAIGNSGECLTKGMCGLQCALQGHWYHGVLQ